MLPSGLIPSFFGEPKSYKYYLMKAISLKEPYIYLFSAALFLLVNRKTLSQLFKKELTTSEAIHNITKSFLNRIQNVFNPPKDIYFEDGILDLD